MNWLRRGPSAPISLTTVALVISACGGSGETVAPALTIEESAPVDTIWTAPAARTGLDAVTQVIVTDSGEVLVADEVSGVVRRFSASGNRLGDLVTAGSGPSQAVPPYTVSVHHDTMFLTPQGPGASRLTWVELRTGLSGQRELRLREASALLCRANGHCLVRHGAPWSTSVPIQRVGESIRDSVVLGWTQGQDSVAWFAHLPGTLDQRGIHIATLAVPRALEVHHASAESVTGVWRDENGVEFVHVYRLRRLQ